MSINFFVGTSFFFFLRPFFLLTRFFFSFSFESSVNFHPVLKYLDVFYTVSDNVNAGYDEYAKHMECHGSHAS